ncbi:MAG TPA: hypothetical protein VL096_02065 [Pirellulaceae bacterium]|nr:hypothetical protein [Pirellulaceae bacterium]
MPLPSETSPEPAPPASWRQAVDNPWVVLGLLFFVMAILGLPILWMSKAFSPPMKIVLSIVVTLYTIAAIGCTGAIVWWAWQSIQESLRQMGSA